LENVKTRVASQLESGPKLRPILGAFLIPPALPVVLIFIDFYVRFFHQKRRNLALDRKHPPSKDALCREELCQALLMKFSKYENHPKLVTKLL
jgi:hypothetical protein